MRDQTLATRRRLYLLARVVVTRHYRDPLTLPRVARALSCSPRQLQRCYAQFGGLSFSEDLQRRRLRVAAQLLSEQRWLTVADVARLVGYDSRSRFACAFRRRYGLSPGIFRQRALASGRQVRACPPGQRALAGRLQRSAPPPSTGEGSRSSRSWLSSPSSAPGASVSAPGSRRRISVPPPGAGSAVTLPFC